LTAPEPHTTPPRPSLGLGLDAGGTQTRWALADATGQLLGEGAVAGLSALQLGSESGRAALSQVLADILAEIATALGDYTAATATATATATAPGKVGVPAVQGIVAGVTGFGDEHRAALHAHLAAAFGLHESAVRSMSDIELACRAAFPAGDGIVVYAGTGSIAALIDASGTLQRAGGRGGVIDDAGGGHWIAREALRQVWRAEDEAPGAWHASALAQRVFDAIGGSDWPATRQWVYGASRGELGLLARAVAAAADDDPAALAILQQAGRELARLGHAMRQRCGPLPLALAGRVFDLHPGIEDSLRAALADSHQASLPLTVQRLHLRAHHTAAVLAAAEAKYSGNP